MTKSDRVFPIVRLDNLFFTIQSSSQRWRFFQFNYQGKGGAIFKSIIKSKLTPFSIQLSRKLAPLLVPIEQLLPILLSVPEGRYRAADVQNIHVAIMYAQFPPPPSCWTEETLCARSRAWNPTPDLILL